MRAHRCPEPLWKCMLCGPVCGMFRGRQDGYSHGGWRPCEELHCISRAGQVHDHQACPCVPDHPDVDHPQMYCDLYVAGRPGRRVRLRARVAGAALGRAPDGIYVISGTVPREEARLTGQELDKLRAMLGRA